MSVCLFVRERFNPQFTSNWANPMRYIFYDYYHFAPKTLNIQYKFGSKITTMLSEFRSYVRKRTHSLQASFYGNFRKIVDCSQCLVSQSGGDRVTILNVTGFDDRQGHYFVRRNFECTDLVSWSPIICIRMDQFAEFAIHSVFGRIELTTSHAHLMKLDVAVSFYWAAPEFSALMNR